MSSRPVALLFFNVLISISVSLKGLVNPGGGGDGRTGLFYRALPRHWQSRIKRDCAQYVHYR